jgi:ParB-like chromosome segregation protein Spo0J
MTEKKGMEELVSISKLEPNEWNPNEQSDFIYLREKRSIEKFGFVMPVLVREVGDKLEILDGEHRYRAMREIHAEGIDIFTTPEKDHKIPKGKIAVKNLGVVSDAAAKQLTILMNELHGEADTIKKADLIKGLADEMDFADLAELLPYPEDELKNLIELADFDWEDYKSGDETRPDEDDERWVTLKFRMAQDQAAIIQSAIERLVRQVPITGENVDARALELMAGDCLATAISSYQ